MHDRKRKKNKGFRTDLVETQMVVFIFEFEWKKEIVCSFKITPVIDKVAEKKLSEKVAEFVRTEGKNAILISQSGENDLNFPETFV